MFNTYITGTLIPERGTIVRLTRYTDYAMRVLIYLGARPDQVCSISDIANGYGVSQNHLMKVVHDLGKAGYVAGVRGRSGGVRLAMPPDRINIGAVVRHAEGEPPLADCDACSISSACALSSIFDQAKRAMFAVLDRHTLADILGDPEPLIRLLGANPSKKAASLSLNEAK